MKPDTDEIWAAKLAASLAQRMGLPVGSLYEPAATRVILRDLTAPGSPSRDDVAHNCRIRLGLL
jgi:hypothetical protein